MNEFLKVQENIYRLKVPFDTVYTSVFLVEFDGGYMLVDCATTEYDVKEYIIPALKHEGIELDQIAYIVVTHHHEDHAGGLDALSRYCRKATVIKEVKTLTESISTYPMPGHTRDCIGVLDLHSKTLISADGIQGYGVDKYRCSTHDEDAYLSTLERVRMDENVENILFSHAFEPWNQDYAFGQKEKNKCLQDSADYIAKRRNI